ncbi:Alpha/beta hydrolase family protein [Mariniflexile rhizosphaerae]|uniref:alpha/beta hydrolase n=1 Tax=unclassified Mariniflexile TaxID=2643887 RepID=UPI000CCB489A|nr:alpha/beta fold hydrolase [Mariniflexile sp. TRM1-10]AXP80180.1 Alpha/beta hydrolase family protein [Mariniflexile sp. TRM1-10]PLB19284.1 MAG: Alpha/beta hydrolase fold family protein [Flavobacteriaceae bacterium FS1-H7996/R]
MNKKIILILFISIFSNDSLSQSKEEPIVLNTETGDIHGTLSISDPSKITPIVLIIAGSGPTDRNGNNPMMTNNSLKMLAESLAEKGISSLRFDKRGIGKSKNSGTKESNLRFEHYINDVKQWCNFIKKDNRFGDLIVLGHSEGSLIGMVASQEKQVDKFISLAGTGFPAGDILRKQLKDQPPLVLEMSAPIIEKLEKGETVENAPEMLYALFRPSVQPYLISWFKYNPQLEIAKLNIPILIVQGTTDIQVNVEDAEKLSESNQKAKKIIIENMNHILKESEAERTKNIQTYSNPKLALKEELIPVLVNFINEH